MATATITPNFTVLSTCDANTGWTGTTTIDNEIYKQGTGSVSGVLNAPGLQTAYYTTPATNLSNTHIRLWFNYTSVGFLDTFVNGGIRIYISDGTNVGYWYVGGIDTYGGGWVLFTVDTSSALDSGTVNMTSITRVGITVNNTGRAKNVINTWIDYLVYGDSVNITGGTSIDPLTLEDISIADSSAGYGAFQRLNGVYFINTAINFGDLVSDMYLEDDNQIIVYENQTVNANLYKFEAVSGTGNTTSLKLSNTVIKSASINTRFKLLLSDVNFNTLLFDNNTIINADTTIFKSTQTVTNSTWNNCNQITTNSASFHGNNILNSSDLGGGLLWPNDATVYDCYFSSNTYAIEMDTAGTYTYNALIFDSNTTDINNTSGGAITINSTNGSNANTFTGTVTINNAVTLTLTGLIAGTEIRVYQAGTTTEVDGIENSLTTFEYTYNYPTGYNVDIVIHNLEYVYIKLTNIVLGSTPTSIPIQQRKDRYYSNPV